VSNTKENVEFSAFPDKDGHFGIYGGRFVSETLVSALDQLTEAYQRLRDDADFQAEFDKDMAHYVGRPSPLYFAERLTEKFGGAQIYLKREDLNHTGAHKINNTIGQALLLNQWVKLVLSLKLEPASMVLHQQLLRLV
jgi:tryptophan synthase beta chain